MALHVQPEATWQVPGVVQVQELQPVEPVPEGPKEPDPETVEAATEVLNELINVSFAGARNRELDKKRVPYVVNRFM